MVSDKILRHYTSPVDHICIVTKCKDTGCRKYGREEALGPGFGRVSGSPCRLAITSQAVNEDDARREILELLPNIKGHSLYCPVLWATEQFDAGRKSLSRQVFRYSILICVWGPSSSSPQESFHFGTHKKRHSFSVARIYSSSCKAIERLELYLKSD